MNKKDTNRKIKVWDLIIKSWSQDIISLENKFVKNIDNINEEWISCQVDITTMNKDDILVKINDISCQMQIDCDICGKSYVADIYNPEYTCIFTTDEKRISKPQDDQEYYLIGDDISIDIWDIIYFAINLELSTVNRCAKCQEKFENDDNWDMYEEEEIEENKSHINTIKFQ